MAKAEFSQKGLCKRINGLRYEQGISQKNLADFLGTSKSYISLMLSGQRNIDVEALHLFCVKLKTHPDYLMHGILPKYF